MMMPKSCSRFNLLLILIAVFGVCFANIDTVFSSSDLYPTTVDSVNLGAPLDDFLALLNKPRTDKKLQALIWDNGKMLDTNDTVQDMCIDKYDGLAPGDDACLYRFAWPGDNVPSLNLSKPIIAVWAAADGLLSAPSNIMNATMRYVGCAWGDCGDGDWALLCSFSAAADTTKREVLETREVALSRSPQDHPHCPWNHQWACQIQENFFAARQMHNLSDNHWSDELGDLAQQHADLCTYINIEQDPLVEIAYVDHITNETNANITVAWDAIHAWQRPPMFYGTKTMYDNVLNETLQFFGCGFAVCGDGTYTVNCILSPWNGTHEAIMARSHQVIPTSMPQDELDNGIIRFVASVRQDQDLPADKFTLQGCPGFVHPTTLAAKDWSTDSAGPHEMGYSISRYAIKNTVDPWFEVVEKAEAEWYVSRFDSAPGTPASGTTYALMIDPTFKYVGCASYLFNEGISGDDFRLLCGFSATCNPASGRNARNYATRDNTPSFDLAGNASQTFNMMRAFVSQQDPSSAPAELTRNWLMEDQTEGDASKCNGVITNPDGEIFFRALTSNVEQDGSEFVTYFSNAVTSWIEAKGEASDETISDGIPLAFDVITNPAYVSFGCSWSPICHQNTPKESYELYCAFSTDKPLAIRGRQVVRGN